MATMVQTPVLGGQAKKLTFHKSTAARIFRVFSRGGLGGTGCGVGGADFSAGGKPTCGENMIFG